jgi:hypothetical protein
MDIAVAKGELIDSPDRGLWPERGGVDGSLRALPATDNPTHGATAAREALEMADDDGRRCSELPSLNRLIIWMVCLGYQAKVPSSLW